MGLYKVTLRINVEMKESKTSKPLGKYTGLVKSESKENAKQLAWDYYKQVILNNLKDEIDDVFLVDAFVQEADNGIAGYFLSFILT